MGFGTRLFAQLAPQYSQRRFQEGFASAQKLTPPLFRTRSCTMQCECLWRHMWIGIMHHARTQVFTITRSCAYAGRIRTRRAQVPPHVCMPRAYASHSPQYENHRTNLHARRDITSTRVHVRNGNRMRRSFGADMRYSRLLYNMPKLRR